MLCFELFPACHPLTPTLSIIDQAFLGAAGFEFSFIVSYTAIIHIISIIDIPFEK